MTEHQLQVLRNDLEQIRRELAAIVKILKENAQ